jgi:phosphoheptose isomerase
MMMGKVDNLVDDLLLLAREPGDRHFRAERLLDEFLYNFISDRNAVRAVLCHLDEALDRAVANNPKHKAFFRATKALAHARHPEPEQMGSDGEIRSHARTHR